MLPGLILLFSLLSLSDCRGLPAEPSCRIQTDVQVIDVDPVTLLPRVRCVEPEGSDRLLGF
jgi:hypothetical protein